MTTATSSTRIRHDSDATFREWGLEFSTFLSTIGLIQTADTGQINWATVARPGTNTNAGYEIWRFDDALQATKPIYIRFDYGTHSVATAPRMQITVGVGTNGAGVITAAGSWTVDSFHQSLASATDVTRNSYFCYDGGTLAFFWKTGVTLRAGIVISRTVDSAGAYSDAGAIIMQVTSSLLRTACMNFTAGTITTKQTSAGNAQLCHWPQAPAASLVGSDQQVACVYGTYPRFRPHIGAVGCLNSEFSAAVTFTATMVGSTPHTYLAAPDNDPHMDASSQLKMAILWE
jgi:hypothetical protein